MIHFITQENLRLLDSQIERAYRRRCDNRDSGASCAFMRDLANDVAFLRAVRDAQRRVEENTTWLRRLASDVAELAKQTDTGTAVRQSSADRRRPPPPTPLKNRKARITGAEPSRKTASR